MEAEINPDTADTVAPELPRQGEGAGPVLPARENPFGLPVVGIGASAGGVSALQTFFEATPSDTGMAFVVVLHLSPDHVSHLPEVIQQITALPVVAVTEPVRAEADHIYVVIPGKHLEISDGILYPRDFVPTLGRRVAIDQFFRTLAEGYGPQVVCVVLSGTGEDGAIGLGMVKEMGGLTVAQEPEDAEYDAMPRAAIATGMVDYVLPAAGMAAQIAEYWEASRRMLVPSDAAPSPG